MFPYTRIVGMCIKTIESVGLAFLGIQSKRKSSFAKNVPVSTGWREEKPLCVVEKHVRKIEHFTCIKFSKNRWMNEYAGKTVTLFLRQKTMRDESIVWNFRFNVNLIISIRVSGRNRKNFQMKCKYFHTSLEKIIGGNWNILAQRFSCQLLTLKI